MKKIQNKQKKMKIPRKIQEKHISLFKMKAEFM